MIGWALTIARPLPLSDPGDEGSVERIRRAHGPPPDREMAGLCGCLAEKVRASPRLNQLHRGQLHEAEHDWQQLETRSFAAGSLGIRVHGWAEVCDFGGPQSASRHSGGFPRDSRFAPSS
jgi:hypothetical protein